jgi:hypothetical protein
MDDWNKLFSIVMSVFWRVFPRIEHFVRQLVLDEANSVVMSGGLANISFSSQKAYDRILKVG